MATLFCRYQRALTTRPLLSAAATSAVLFGVGNVIAQQGIEKKGWRNHDLMATARASVYGGLIFGPAATGWFRFLEKYVSFNKSPNLQVVARVACDQLFFAPVAITAFFSAMTVMEGGDVKKKLQSTWWDAVRANWHLWPVIQLLNFRLVPLPMRIVVVNVVSIGWNSYLAYLNTKKDEVVDEASKDVDDVSKD